MNNANQTTITVDYEFQVDPGHPISTYSETIQNARCANFHAHPRAQLTSCNSGIMKVVTGRTIWGVTQSQSVWITGDDGRQFFSLTTVVNFQYPPTTDQFTKNNIAAL